MKKKIIASLVLVISLCINVNAVYADTLTKAQWEKECNDWTQVAVNVGKDETEMNFAWYSKDGQLNTFVYGMKADLSDKKEVIISKTKAQDGYISNKVTITELKENTTYYYQISDRKVECFKTQQTDAFQFIVTGDPQIGCSNESEDSGEEYIKAGYEANFNDCKGWENTLVQAMKKTNNKASFILSTGDQTNNEFGEFNNVDFSEMEYSAFLYPSVLRSIPIATTVGNHDATNPNYLYHFNLPNMSNLGAHEVTGGDYYYTYGNALFMVLNVQGTDNEEHKEFINKTVKDHPNCKWKIISLHQDIYGSGEHSNEPEVVKLRYALRPTYEENNIDVVFSGHDHTYSRSQFLKGENTKKDISFTDDEFIELYEKDTKTDDGSGMPFVSAANIKKDTDDEAEKKYLEYLESIMDSEAVVNETKDTQTVKNPKGVLYITTNSASGSHYYEMVAREQSYVAARWQEYVPTYSVINISDSTLTINTYRADTNEAIDKEIQIIKDGSSKLISINTKVIISICIISVVVVVLLLIFIICKKAQYNKKEESSQRKQ